MPGQEGLLELDNIVNAPIGVEGSLDIRKSNERAIGSASPKEDEDELSKDHWFDCQLLPPRGRETNRVVEDKTQRLVDLFAALIVKKG